MLSGQRLHDHAGLLLTGDYESLQWLHQTVHDVNDRSPIVRDKEGAFLGLAYDVRKAYEGQREIIPRPRHQKSLGERYGVRILWPVLLLQQRILRVSLAFLDHSRRHQAITYALESVIEDGLQEDFGNESPAIIEQWQRLDPTYPDIVDKLDTRCALFCSWSNRDRKRRLAALLASFGPLYALAPAAGTSGRGSVEISPAELERWVGADWPDPRW